MNLSGIYLIRWCSIHRCHCLISLWVSNSMISMMCWLHHNDNSKEWMNTIPSSQPHQDILNRDKYTYVAINSELELLQWMNHQILLWNSMIWNMSCWNNSSSVVMINYWMRNQWWDWIPPRLNRRIGRIRICLSYSHLIHHSWRICHYRRVN